MIAGAHCRAHRLRPGPGAGSCGWRRPSRRQQCPGSGRPLRRVHTRIAERRSADTSQREASREQGPERSAESSWRPGGNGRTRGQRTGHRLPVGWRCCRRRRRPRLGVTRLDSGGFTVSSSIWASRLPAPSPAGPACFVGLLRLIGRTGRVTSAEARGVDRSSRTGWLWRDQQPAAERVLEVAPRSGAPGHERGAAARLALREAAAVLQPSRQRTACAPPGLELTPQQDLRP